MMMYLVYLHLKKLFKFPFFLCSDVDFTILQFPLSMILENAKKWRQSLDRRNLSVQCRLIHSAVGMCE